MTHIGVLVENEATAGHFDPKSAKINFVTPDRRMLKEDELIVTSKEPGIFPDMMKIVSQTDVNQMQSYKLCVDGKRINPCSKGEVNLWGFEAHPSYTEKKERLEDEISFFRTCETDAEDLISFGLHDLKELSDSTKQKFNSSCNSAGMYTLLKL